MSFVFKVINVKILNAHQVRVINGMAICLTTLWKQSLTSLT